MAVAGDVIQAYIELDDAEKEKVNRAVRALPDPPAKFVGWLWLIVVVAFVALLLGAL